MPHKIKRAFDEALTFEKLLQAHVRAKKNKTSRMDLIRYEMNLENNLMNLFRKLKDNTYHLGKYNTFYIYEPKERAIMSLPYQDRIVHQWYVEEFIKPYILPKFIATTFACIPNRGTHKAVDAVQKMMRKMQQEHPDYWILKCDIKKFFYHIDKHILFRIMQFHIKDKKLLNFTKQLIFENQDPTVKGIPIGNYTSQFFANIYLNELDQYIKHYLHVKYYVRYMDDFILLLETKESCKEHKRQIEFFLSETLELELNHKSRYYPHYFGIDFCGYRTYPTHKRLRNSSKKNMFRKINQYNKIYHKGKLDCAHANASFCSWLGHAAHANTYHLRQKLLNKCDFFYTPKYDEFLENDLLQQIVENTD